MRDKLDTSGTPRPTRRGGAPNWLHSFPVPSSFPCNFQTRCRAVITRGGGPECVRYCFRDLLGAECCKVGGQWPGGAGERRGGRGRGRPASDGFCRSVAGHRVPGISHLAPDGPGTMLLDGAAAAAKFSARKIPKFTKFDKVSIPKNAFGRSM